ncbi:MAG: CcmD family protein [Deltaproteobacteria bacterium]|nr:CcmD family protein [Deltaproteobacteria bacterium]NCP95228.1 CcmD family protein [Deltaproteobacteria bacterium]NCS74583.1 CcmD family protein [Deltaproteobacteria bacterium]
MSDMSPDKFLDFLFAGYGAFWTILFGYLGMIFSRQRRLLREVEELRRELSQRKG